MTDQRCLAGLRVLVVEDETLVSLLIEDVLAEQACVVVGPYHRISDALSAISEQTVDLAVLDMNVGGIMVFPVAEALAALGVPFLFLSGYGASAIPDDHPEWRVCEKPFNDKDLVAMLVEQMALSSTDTRLS